MEAYLQVKGVLFKDFKDFAVGVTERIKSAALRLAASRGSWESRWTFRDAAVISRQSTPNVVPTLSACTSCREEDAG
jgi:hypothetical protein